MSDKTETKKKMTQGKQVDRRPSVKAKSESLFSWPFGLRNLILLGIAILVILVGYIFLAKGPHDSFSSLTFGPLLLILGYLVLVPLAIVIKSPAKNK